MQAGGPQVSRNFDHALELLGREIDALRIDTGAHAAYLLNSSGQLIYEIGEARGVEASVLGMLVAGGMATTLEMAQVLHEQQVASLHFYRGRRHEIYASAVDSDHLVCLVLEKYSQQSQIGIVWLCIKRCQARIRPLLQVMEASPGAEPMLRADDLAQAIDDIREVSVQAQSEPSAEAPGQSDETSEGRPLYTWEQATELGLLGDSKTPKDE